MPEYRSISSRGLKKSHDFTRQLFCAGFCLCIILLSTFFSTVFAADNPIISDESKNQLTSQSETFRKETSRPIQKKPPAPPEIETNEKEEPAPPKDAGPSFEIQAIELAGSTVFKPSDFDSMVHLYENKKISFYDLKMLVQAITQHYRSRGYTTSRAYIPPQDMKQGKAKILILEGKVGDVIVDKNKYFSAGIYQSLLRMNKGQVFRYQDLERNMITLNQKPDRNAKAYLMPGQDVGTSDILLKVHDTIPIHGSYEFHNRGTKLTRRTRHNFHVNFNNFSGFDDVLQADYTMSEEGALSAVATAYELPWNAIDAALRLNFSYAASQLVRHLKTFEVTGESINFVPEFSKTILRNQKIKLETNLAGEYKNSETLIGGARTSFDRTRVVKPSVVAQINDKWGRSLFGLSAHFGIPNLFGGMDKIDDNSTRPSTGGQFLFYNLDVSRLNRLPLSSILIMKGNVMLTHTALPSLEQFRIGGAYSVRGYPESDALGDYGYSLSSEINTPVPFLPSEWALPFLPDRWRDCIHLAGFIDFGKTYLKDRVLPTDIKDRFLLGAGFGIRFNLRDYLSLRADYGFPIGDASSDNDTRNQLHFSIRAGF